MNTASPPIPEGFRVVKMRTNPFIEGVGPLYGRLVHTTASEAGTTASAPAQPATVDMLVGLRLERRHCNPGMTCHGGMVSTFADMTLILGANVRTGLQRYLTTIHLSCDFVGPAVVGDWLEGRCEVLRASKNLVFCEGRITANGAVVARISGILKPVGEPNPSSTPESYFEG